MLNTKDQTELNIVLHRAGYVLVCCVAMAVITVSLLILR